MIDTKEKLIAYESTHFTTSGGFHFYDSQKVLFEDFEHVSDVYLSNQMYAAVIGGFIIMKIKEQFGI